MTPTWPLASVPGGGTSCVKAGRHKTWIRCRLIRGPAILPSLDWMLDLECMLSNRRNTNSVSIAESEKCCKQRRLIETRNTCNNDSYIGRMKLEICKVWMSNFMLEVLSTREGGDVRGDTRVRAKVQPNIQTILQGEHGNPDLGRAEQWSSRK